MNAPAIVGAVVGSALAVCAVIGITAFVQRRRTRRRARHRSILSSSMEDGSQMMAIPFNAVPSDATLDSGNWMEQQPLVPGDRDAEVVALHRLSSSPPAALARLRPVAPIPPGLSSKDIARIRAEALSSQPSSQHSYNNSTSSVSQSMSPPETSTDSSGATRSSYDPRRLHSEVESLRREMERLRTEGLVPEPPPSYTEGGR
ncbi:hypothetical protein BJV77DRAFT_172884 [Russula vinacea]|nr:hypothetical protein BJV77DRAFT_172884 [Russula vinacea]